MYNCRSWKLAARRLANLFSNNDDNDDDADRRITMMMAGE